MSAVSAPNRFLESRGRRLAYRQLGTGKPLVLLTRFRGNMDLWDPLFLDISFPIENWYALGLQLPTMHLLTLPRAGHAPHHQEPLAVARHIAAFAGVSPA